MYRILLMSKKRLKWIISICLSSIFSTNIHLFLLIETFKKNGTLLTLPKGHICKNNFILHAYIMMNNLNIMIRRITVVFLLLAFAKFGNAQLLQFNQWQHAPAMLNPALTGAYNGTFRIGAIGKEKWGSAATGGLGSGWNTLEVFVDAPIIRGFRKKDWIGVGISYDLDASGSVENVPVNLGVSGLNLAYHLGFGKKYKGAFTIAGSYSLKSKTVDISSARSEEEIVEGTPTAALFTNAMMKELTGDAKTWTVGVAYKAQMNKKNDIAFGLSMGQFGTQNFGVQGQDDLDTRTTAFFRFKTKTGKKSSFEPQIVFLKEGVNEKLYTQAIFGYMFKPDWDFKYGAGINTLNNDFNIPIYLGVDYKSWRIGLAYDVDLGATAQTGTYGGLELAVNYIHVLSKKPKPDPIIICPRL